MVVTVLVTGMPLSASISDIACYLDRLFRLNNISDDIYTFRVRDVSVGLKRQIALDFQSGFDAIAAQQLLHKYEYLFPSGNKIKLRARITRAKDLVSEDVVPIICGTPYSKKGWINLAFDPDEPEDYDRAEGRMFQHSYAQFFLNKHTTVIISQSSHLERNALFNNYFMEHASIDNNDYYQPHVENYARSHEHWSRSPSTEWANCTEGDLSYHRSPYYEPPMSRPRPYYDYNEPALYSRRRSKSRSPGQMYGRRSQHEKIGYASPHNVYSSNAPIIEPRFDDLRSNSRQRSSSSTRAKISYKTCGHRREDYKNRRKHNKIHRNKDKGFNERTEKEPPNIEVTLPIAIKDIMLEFEIALDMHYNDAENPSVIDVSPSIIQEIKQIVMKMLQEYVEKRLSNLNVGGLPSEIVSCYRQRHSIEDDWSLVQKLVKELRNFEIKKETETDVEEAVSEREEDNDNDEIEEIDNDGEGELQKDLENPYGDIDEQIGTDVNLIE